MAKRKESKKMNEELKTKLIELGYSEEDIAKLEKAGIENDEDFAKLEKAGIKKAVDISLFDASDFKEAGFNIATAKKLVAAFAPAPEPVTAPATVMYSTPSVDSLPQPPDDIAFLAMLKTGGELKVGPTEVISAVRAAQADNFGMFKLPKKILALVEETAEHQDEPVGKDYITIRNLVTRHSYSEIFAAFDLDTAAGIITEDKKDKLLSRLRSVLWPAFMSFREQVNGYVASYNQISNNPMAFMSAMQSMIAGVPAMGMIPLPDTASLHDAAAGVIDIINHVFAGTGIITARALAYDANRIRELLENPMLPTQVGVTTRDLMLKRLEVNVSADYVRQERSIVRYAMGIMEYAKVTPGNEEYNYIMALWSLGNAIPWDNLTNGGRSSSDDTFQDKKKDNKPY